MFFTILSPFLALLYDRVSRKNKIGEQWTILLIVLLVIPTLALRASGYSFTNRSFSFITATLFLASIQIAVLAIVNVRHSVKLVAALVFTLGLVFICFGRAFVSEWSGSRTILKEIQYQNYRALILGPQLYENDKLLRVTKNALAGVLQKNVYEQYLPDSSYNAKCNITFRDGSKQLAYDLCNDNLHLVD